MQSQYLNYTSSITKNEIKCLLNNYLFKIFVTHYSVSRKYKYLQENSKDNKNIILPWLYQNIFRKLDCILNNIIFTLFLIQNFYLN